MNLALVSDLSRFRSLIYQLVRRDVLSRYQGSNLGALWTFVFPLVSLAVYALVFGYILTPKWPGIEGPWQFTLILFPGLLIFNFFSECISRAPQLISANASYVKKVVFPLHLLAYVPLGAAAFHFMFGLLAWLGLVMIVSQEISATYLLLPLILLPLLFMTLGLSWFLACFGVYFRDLGHITIAVTQLLLYLSPIIYPRTALPESVRWLLSLNPITIPVEAARNVLNFHRQPDWVALGSYTIVSLLVLVLGLSLFEKTRSGFADVV